jgi:hypothetical protein
MTDVIEEDLLAERELAIGLRRFNHEASSRPATDALLGK